MRSLGYLRWATTHQQAQRILPTKIITGEWEDSDRLPTELALMERFRVSRTKIREALMSCVPTA